MHGSLNVVTCKSKMYQGFSSATSQTISRCEETLERDLLTSIGPLQLETLVQTNSFRNHKQKLISNVLFEHQKTKVKVAPSVGFRDISDTPKFVCILVECYKNGVVYVL